MIFAALLLSISIPGQGVVCEEKERISPQVEQVAFQKNLSFSEWAFRFDHVDINVPALSTESFSLALFDWEFVEAKQFPFIIKKGINFSRELAKNEYEKLEVIVEAFEKDSIAFTSPNLKEGSTQKRDFLSEKPSFQVKDHLSVEAKPFAFNEEKGSSNLIESAVPLKKIEPKSSQLSKKLQIENAIPQRAADQKKIESDRYFPRLEKKSKQIFQSKEKFLCLNERDHEKRAFFSDRNGAVEAKLFERSVPNIKVHLPQKELSSHCFVANIQWKNRALESDVFSSPNSIPIKEEVEAKYKVKEKDIALSLPFDEEKSALFDHHFSSIDLSQVSWNRDKYSFTHLDKGSIKELPYLYVQSYSVEKESACYFPTNERVPPGAQKYALSKGPTLAMEINDQVIAFSLTPEFELFSGDGDIRLPKKAQEFQASALALLEPYLDYKDDNKNEYPEKKPKQESFEALAFSEQSHSLELSEMETLSDPFLMEETEPSVLPMIAHSMDFPHLKSEKKASDLPIDDYQSLGCDVEVKKEVQLTPSQEPKRSLPQGDAFALSFSDSEKEEVAFSSQEKIALQPQPQAFVPKQELSKTFSDLHPKQQMAAKKSTAAEHFEFESGYSPVLQKTKTPVSKSELVLSFPNEKESIFDFQYPNEWVALSLSETEEALMKFMAMKRVGMEPPQFSLPYVKRKDILPKPMRFKSVHVSKDIPSFESMEELLSGKGVPRQMAKVHCPSNEVAGGKEIFHQFKGPHLSSFQPPEGWLPFALESSYMAIKEERIEYIKARSAPYETTLGEIPLPYVVGRKIIPNKALFVPKQSLGDFSDVENMVELANRDVNFPNAKALLEKNPLPVSAETSIANDIEAVASVETAMIRSQAKEILEDYNEENRASAEFIALEKPQLVVSLAEAEAKSLNQSSRFTNAFLSEIPPPSHLDTVTYSNEFDTEVHYTKKEDGKGYYFAVKLKSGEKLNFGSPEKHFIFVIDGSSSIKKHRFGVFKEGVGRALSYLSERDSFNIVIADSKFRTLSEKPMPWSREATQKANQFLLAQEYRGFFVNYDPFDLLKKVSNYIHPEKENIVVLMTDGHSFHTIKEHKEDFKKLLAESRGRFSVFTATASQGNNLSMLDLLSTFNNGELMYSKTNAAFSRQLAVLVKHVETFVAKEIHVNVTSATSQTGIEFYPNEKTLPALYADRPYVIYGSIDELKDFDMILQGRAGDQWINIKQSISFRHATHASHTIKKGMALQKAYVCYDYFLDKDDTFFLNEAQKILETFNIPTAMR